jgi:hypothetical protein
MSYSLLLLFFGAFFSTLNYKLPTQKMGSMQNSRSCKNSLSARISASSQVSRDVRQTLMT